MPVSIATTMSLTKSAPLSDADLNARIRKGDERAFRLLFERYYVALCRYGTGLLGDRDASEDVVQALFIRIWNRRDEWSVRGSIRAYLYRAVHRRVVNEWHAARVRTKHAERERRSAAAGLGATGSKHAPDSGVRLSELETAYGRALASLPPRRRQAFELHRHHGLTYREIAEVMGITPGTVELHIGKALLAFRKALAANLSLTLLLTI